MHPHTPSPSGRGSRDPFSRTSFPGGASPADRPRRRRPDVPDAFFGPEPGARRRHHGPGGGHDGGPRGFGPGAGFGPGGPGHGGHGFGPGFGFGPGPRGRGGRRGGRAGRGEIRAAVLVLLAEQPMHGYQIITELAERTDGRWRPSPGAVYPALSLLEDEGLVTVTPGSGRRLAELTEAGRAYVTEHADELGTPWEAVAGRRSERHALREAVGGLVGAVEQVARTGTDAQTAAAAAILDRARRDVYRLLAQEPGDTDAPDPADAPA